MGDKIGIGAERSTLRPDYVVVRNVDVCLSQFTILCCGSLVDGLALATADLEQAIEGRLRAGITHYKFRLSESVRRLIHTADAHSLLPLYNISLLSEKLEIARHRSVLAAPLILLSFI